MPLKMHENETMTPRERVEAITESLIALRFAAGISSGNTQDCLRFLQ